MTACRCRIHAWSHGVKTRYTIYNLNKERPMEAQTDERLADVEKRLSIVDERLAVVENALAELRMLLRRQGVKPGKNYGAP